MNKQMFENAVLAILRFAPELGGTKLRKALCIADAVHTSLHKQSITGCKYIKGQYGTIPEYEGYQLLLNMLESGTIEIRKKPSGNHFEDSYTATQSPEDSLLSQSQLDILKYAAELVATLTAKELSEKTHDAVYHSVNMGEEIPLDKICVPRIVEDSSPFTEQMRNDARKYFESNANCVLANS